MEVGANATKPTLLVVEDDLDLAQALAEHFTEAGFFVEKAGNGVEALRYVLQRDYAAVVCDMVMPQMPGDMFYRAVQRVRPKLCDRFLFITGHGESPEVRDFLVGMSDRVFTKPFNYDDLTAAVRDLLPGSGARRLEIS